MSKDDINSLGSVYGGMLNGLKKDLIKEGKIGPNEVGDTALLDGGPTEEGGFTEPEVDIEKLSDKEKKDNLYNVNNLSYTSSYVPAAEEDEEEEDGENKKPDEDGDGVPDWADKKPGEEDKEGEKDADKEKENEESEESLEITEKIARDSLNNFMSKKSYFDRLYENVMGDDLPSADMDQAEELDALGIDDSSEDGSDEVTVTLSRDVAQTLCDTLKAACGDSEDSDEGDVEMAFGEEDEEGIDTGSTHSGKYDDGKNNKVGDLKTAAAATAKGADSKLDAGSTHSGSYDDGKNNKVGSLKTGSRAVD